MERMRERTSHYALWGPSLSNCHCPNLHLKRSFSLAMPVPKEVRRPEAIQKWSDIFPRLLRSISFIDTLSTCPSILQTKWVPSCTIGGNDELTCCTKGWWEKIIISTFYSQYISATIYLLDLCICPLCRKMFGDYHSPREPWTGGTTRSVVARVSHDLFHKCFKRKGSCELSRHYVDHFMIVILKEF